MKNARLIFSLLVVLFSVHATHGGYKMGEDRPISTSKSAQPSKSRQQDAEKTALAGLSRTFSVPVDRLEYFRKLKYGYEEIVPALIVAREAQVEPGRVLKSRMEGETWKTIADSFSIDLKPLNKEVVEILKPIRKALPKQALSERPQVRN